MRSTLACLGRLGGGGREGGGEKVGSLSLDATPPDFLRVNHYAPSINEDRECPEPCVEFDDSAAVDWAALDGGGKS